MQTGNWYPRIQCDAFGSSSNSKNNVPIELVKFKLKCQISQLSGLLNHQKLNVRT